MKTAIKGAFLAHLNSAVPKIFIVMICYRPHITHLRRVMFLFSLFKGLLLISLLIYGIN